MACASFSSHLSLVRSISYSRANQSSVKRLRCTSLVSHVTTLLIVLSSTMKALISICSPPFPGQLTCSRPLCENGRQVDQLLFALVGVLPEALDTPAGILGHGHTLSRELGLLPQFLIAFDRFVAVFRFNLKRRVGIRDAE